MDTWAFEQWAAWAACCLQEVRVSREAAGTPHCSCRQELGPDTRLPAQPPAPRPGMAPGLKRARESLSRTPTLSQGSQCKSVETQTTLLAVSLRSVLGAARP